jgi:predicted O-methyltransferase YrrM
MRSFINSLDGGNAPFLDELEREAIKDEVPIIRKDTQALLKFLMAQSKPVNILEVGCAIGFSALLMAHYSLPETKITTIEKYEKRIPVAKENFIKYDTDNKITLLEGDATEILKTLSPGYDFIFMDAAKAQYPVFLPEVLRLLTPGGMLVSDNVLQEGDILESRYAVTRRDRTIHARMREFLYEITHNPMLDTIILPTGDGVSLSVKKEEDQTGEKA